jgi:hypothetical protein
MLIRFSELTGADQYLDDSPLGRLFAAYIRAFAAHDL